MDSDAAVRTAFSNLPAIPYIDLTNAGPVALAAAERARMEALVAAGRNDYGRLFMTVGDRMSRRWLVRTGNPYLAELDDIAAVTGGPGTHLLNLSYEWFCTSGVSADPSGVGSRMMRTLDWPLPGLGRNVVVTHQDGAAGPYFNVTWPGFVGVATAMAPGRFSAAFNQAPMRRGGRSLAGDWLRNRLGVWRSRGLPPAHLLRRVFDDCASYAEARATLCKTPICLPALFVLGGVSAEEGCVIERLETRAIVHEAPRCVANHWLSPGLDGDPRGVESHERLAAMETYYKTDSEGFSWLVRPIVNDCTRVAVVANAAAGRLDVQGWEADGPATAVFRL